MAWLAALRMKLIHRLQGDLHLKELLKGSSVALGLRLFGALLGYGFTLLITRNYGAAAMGIFTLSLTVLNMGALVGKFGLDTAGVRLIAAYAGKKQWGNVHDVYRRIFVLGTALAIATGLVFYGVAPQIAGGVFQKPYLTSYFRITALAIIPFVLFNIHAQSLRGLKKIKATVFLQYVSLSLAGSVGLTICVLLALRQPGIPLYVYLISILLTSLLAFVLWKMELKKLPRTGIGKPGEATISSGEMVTIGFHMMLSGSLLLLMGWIDKIMLGMFTTESEVGIYAVALRVAAISTIPMFGINAIAAPKFAELYGSQKLPELKRLIRQSSKLNFWTAFPIIVISLLFPKFILSLFGEQFTGGVMVLLILCTGRLVGATCGLIAPILRMVGKERALNLILLIATILNIVLNIILIPRYGINGAAIASMLSMLLWNLTSVLYARKALGISSLYVPGVKGEA